MGGIRGVSIHGSTGSPRTETGSRPADTQLTGVFTQRPYNARMTDAPFNWKQPAGKALEMALNRALSLDAETQAALRGLDGQRVALQLTSPPLALQVRVEGEALRVGPVDAAQEPDLGVRTTLAGATTLRRSASCASRATPNSRAACSSLRRTSIPTGSNRS